MNTVPYDRPEFLSTKKRTDCRKEQHTIRRSSVPEKAGLQERNQRK